MLKKFGILMMIFCVMWIIYGCSKSETPTQEEGAATTEQAPAATTEQPAAVDTGATTTAAPTEAPAEAPAK